MFVAAVVRIRRFFVAGDGVGSGSGRASWGVAGAPRIGPRYAAYGVSGLEAGTPIWGLQCRPQPRANFSTHCMFALADRFEPEPKGYCHGDDHETVARFRPAFSRPLVRVGGGAGGAIRCRVFQRRPAGCFPEREHQPAGPKQMDASMAREFSREDVCVQR